MIYKTSEEIKEKQRKWYSANREKIRERQRKYYIANKKERAEYGRKYHHSHKEKAREYARKWSIANREKIRERVRKYNIANPEKMRELCKRDRRRIRREVLKHYSNNSFKCANCGYNTFNALVIDHAYGGGNRHKKEIKKSGGGKFYHWLKKNKYPLGFQVLCWNCNFLKSNYPEDYTEIGKKYRESKSKTGKK